MAAASARCRWDRRVMRRRGEAVAVHWCEVNGPAAPAAYLNEAIQRTPRRESLIACGGESDIIAV